MLRILITGGSGFIGTNLIKLLIEDGNDVVNFDRAPPLCEDQVGLWMPGDVRDCACLSDALEAHDPQAVLHLAAEARVDPRFSLESYCTNTVGTQNVLRALQLRRRVERLVITSTQYVCRPGYVPAHEEDYAPHTLYGYSKALSESMTRRARLEADWCIVRPTTIWGPWDLKYRRDFYWSLRKGLYLHPARGSAVRSMGFVGNVTSQYAALLSAPADRITGRTFYMGDLPVALDAYVDAFSQRLRGRPARRAPNAGLEVLAGTGQLLKALGLPSPLDMKRYRSMVEDYPVDLRPILEIAGPGPFTLEEGVEQTVRWLVDGEFDKDWRAWRFR